MACNSHVFGFEPAAANDRYDFSRLPAPPALRSGACGCIQRPGIPLGGNCLLNSALHPPAVHIDTAWWRVAGIRRAVAVSRSKNNAICIHCRGSFSFSCAAHGAVPARYPGHPERDRVGRLSAARALVDAEIGLAAELSQNL